MSEGGQEVTGVEVLGFASWITSAAAYVVYILWAYTPASVLHQHGISYYPDKYWALALPTWICLTVIFIYWTYESLNMIHTSPNSEVDKATEADIDTELRKVYFSTSQDAGLLPLVEIPDAVVNMILDDGVPPIEAEAMYKERLRAKQRDAGKFNYAGRVTE